MRGLLVSVLRRVGLPATQPSPQGRSRSAPLPGAAPRPLWSAPALGAMPWSMTNTIAIWLVIFIALAVGYDYLQHDSAGALFLARKGVDLLQWVAFWR